MQLGPEKAPSLQFRPGQPPRYLQMARCAGGRVSFNFQINQREDLSTRQAGRAEPETEGQRFSLTWTWALVSLASPDPVF